MQEQFEDVFAPHQREVIMQLPYQLGARAKLDTIDEHACTTHYCHTRCMRKIEIDDTDLATQARIVSLKKNLLTRDAAFLSRVCCHETQCC